MTYSLNKLNGVPRVVEDSNLCSLIVAALLSIDVANGDEQGPPCESKLTAFHALSAPNISVSTYMSRLAHYCFASNAVQLLAFYYMRRAAKADPRLEPTSRSVHRLLITCMVVAAKYLDDIAYNLSYYAKVGGLPVSELAYLELSLLTLLKFNLHISVEDFHSLEQDLLTELENAPPTEAVETARKALYKAGVRKTARNTYFITMHEGEAPLTWDTHSNPRKRVLPSPEPEVEEPIDVSSDLDDELFEDFSKMDRFDSSSTITSDIMSPETSTCSLSPVAVRSIMCDVRPERTHRRVSFPKSQMYQHIPCSPPTPSSKCCRAIEQYAQFAKFEQEVEATLCR